MKFNSFLLNSLSLIIIVIFELLFSFFFSYSEIRKIIPELPPVGSEMTLRSIQYSVNEKEEGAHHDKKGKEGRHGKTRYSHGIKLLQ